MRSLLRLKPFVRPYYGLLLTSILLALPLSALRSAPAPLLKYVVDDLFVSKDASKLLIYPLVIVGIYAANFVIRFFHYYLIRIAIGRVNQAIKNRLYEHLLGLSADYFTSQSTGTLISRVGADPNYLDQGLASLNILAREPITFLVLFGYALNMNWKLTFLMLFLLPPLAWLFSRTGKHFKRYVGRLTEENARLFSTVQESFTGIRIVKTFRLEKYVRKKFRERSAQFAKTYLKIAALEEAAHPMVELLIAFVAAAMVYFGGRMLVRGTMTPGELLSFLAAFALMVNPIRSLNDVNMKLHQAGAACTRIFEVLDWRSHIEDGPDARTIRAVSREIRLENVSFAYPDAPERPVLKGVSLAIPCGQTVALVGASGAGKSSLVSLLPRIFDVTGGRIEIDGVDIRQLRINDLRSLIAVVSQDVFLFNDTIEENIRCGRLSATSAEIREAARRAHALDFIERAPEGFDSVIGDRGQKLSGGERQRLSIARAFLREAPILILDEATSSLDSASERAVQTALEELMKNRTTLVIAHRLSTIRNADRIFVLREGNVVEHGSHDELVKLDGEYARFHLGQAT